jgi:hypothetical protein
MVSVQSVIDDIKDLRTNTKERRRGYAYIMSNEDVAANRFEIDALDVLEELKEYEVDLRETIMPVDATNPYYLDTYYNPNYSSVEYKDYCIEEYLPEGWEVGRGDNSYNWMANVTNTINFVEITAPDGEEFLVIRFHRWGDERVNYSDDILCKMAVDDLYELDSTYKSEEIEVDGRVYIVNTNLFSEGMEIVGYNEENSEYDFEEEYYDYADEESIASFIRETWKERAQEAVL